MNYDCDGRWTVEAGRRCSRRCGGYDAHFSALSDLCDMTCRSGFFLSTTGRSVFYELARWCVNARVDLVKRVEKGREEERGCGRWGMGDECWRAGWRQIPRPNAKGWRSLACSKYESGSGSGSGNGNGNGNGKGWIRIARVRERSWLLVMAHRMHEWMDG